MGMWVTKKRSGGLELFRLLVCAFCLLPSHLSRNRFRASSVPSLDSAIPLALIFAPVLFAFSLSFLWSSPLKCFHTLHLFLSSNCLYAF